jgi:hypothetical protein
MNRDKLAGLSLNGLRAQLARTESLKDVWFERWHTVANTAWRTKATGAWEDLPQTAHKAWQRYEQLVEDANAVRAELMKRYTPRKRGH